MLDWTSGAQDARVMGEHRDAKSYDGFLKLLSRVRIIVSQLRPRQSCGIEERMQSERIMFCKSHNVFSRRSKVTQVVGNEVGKLLVLGPRPQLLYRVEFRGVCRQLENLQPGVEILRHLLSARPQMQRGAVLHEDQGPPGPPQHALAQEIRVKKIIDVLIDKRLVDQPRPPRPRGTKQRRHDTHLLAMLGPRAYHRCACRRRETASYQRCHQKPGFIGENNICSKLTGFFLMRAPTPPPQALSSSSRSCATRLGTGGVMPRRPSQSLRYRRFICTPSSRATSSATRRAVHRWVGKPKSQGLLSSQDKTVDAWPSSSLGGRPGRGRSAKAESPDNALARAQRCTPRTLTPMKSATPRPSYPPSNLPTATRRRCSSVRAFLGS